MKGIIFDVKGLVHPPDKVISFPRFIPEPSGNRKQEGITYKKIYALSTRFEFLEKNFPQYVIYDSVFDEKLCGVPSENIETYYSPVGRLQELRRSKELDELELCALEFCQCLKDYADTSWDKMGISGSLLVKLHTLSSDIDPVIYGTKNCRKVYEALKALQQDAKSAVKSYSMKELRELFRFRLRDTRVSFEDFIRTESRKVLQGKFKGRDYFIRFVKDWSEIQEKYGAVQYRNAGYARIKAEIKDDSEAIFTPCGYKLRNVEVLEGVHPHPIEEIASFRGRFCEQARISETVIAQGKVEHVIDNRQNREYFRLLIGNKPSDYMVLA
ncbi:MAG: hypothetical protein QMD13_02925 [Candidatus Bathyarchaeia archaeon]|nr:hypothetical protein [Candidatus Bathyarchaeia archaeon]